MLATTEIAGYNENMTGLDKEIRAELLRRAKRKERERKRAERLATPKGKQQEKQRKARQQAQKAIAEGRIERTACAICGGTPTEAHHPNYDKPEYVVFLCKYHHSVAHYYQQLHEKGKIAAITRNIVRKYHEKYTETHKY